jgi:hypothetical protein
MKHPLELRPPFLPSSCCIRSLLYHRSNCNAYHASNAKACNVETWLCRAQLLDKACSTHQHGLNSTRRAFSCFWQRAVNTVVPNGIVISPRTVVLTAVRQKPLVLVNRQRNKTNKKLWKIWQRSEQAFRAHSQEEGQRNRHALVTAAVL